MKYKNTEELLEIKKNLEKEGRKLVLCHGHFNVIHPGHLRILNFAKEKGDYLVVSVLNDNDVVNSLKDEFFSQVERASGMNSLNMVDAVCLLPGTIKDFIENLQPHIYVKGREFEDHPEVIQEEIDAVSSYGGDLVYSSGEVQYSGKRIFSEEPNDSEESSQKVAFLKTCKKHDINIQSLKDQVEKFKKLKILVLGDTIVDQFVACDMLGVSSEAPVLAIRELKTKDFVGGAAIVAMHLKSLGAECTYMSVVGADQPAEFIRSEFNKAGVCHDLIEDVGRPTTFKIRYVVENQKILRVSRLNQNSISSKLENVLLEKLDALADDFDGIVISDFVYGVITEKILNKICETAKAKNIKLFGDLQCSSQIGDVSKFKNFDLLTPTEKETRIAMGDYSSGLEKLAHNFLAKTNTKKLVITLGNQGLLAYSKPKNIVVSEFFPAIESNPVDVAGAGDSLLSSYALSLCSDCSLLEASALGACVAAISVKRMGNIPISKSEINSYLDQLLEMERGILLCQN